MAGFLDFVGNIGDYIPGGASALPSWLTSLIVKKPNMNVSDAAPYFQALGQTAAQGNAFNNDQANFYANNYRPAAVAFNNRAQGVGGQADLNEASNRSAADFEHAFAAKRADATRDMAGVNPNSGAAQARLGAIDASYAPGVVDAMNKGRAGREQYGDTLRAQALPMLATTPNFAGAGSLYGAAGTGALYAGKMANDQYRQEAADTVKALKLPGDLDDKNKRQKTNEDNTGGILAQIKQRFPSGDTSSGGGWSGGYTGNDAPSDNSWDLLPS